MAFIPTHDSIAHLVLMERYGLSLKDAENCFPDREETPYTLRALPGTDSPDMTLTPVVVAPRIFQDDNNCRSMCFLSVMELNLKPARGEYRLDPTNAYKPARRSGDVFVNRITVGEDELSPTTWTLLFDFMRKRHDVKPSVVYTLADIPPATFHRIRNKQPKRETLFRLGVILQLTLEEMEQLLASAGFAFNTADKRDMLLKKCFTERVLNIDDVRRVLYNGGVETMEFGNFARLNPPR